MIQPVPLILTAVFLAAYAFGLARLRRRGAVWPRGRTTAAVVGSGCVAAAFLPPVGGHHAMMFSFHMAQHLLLAMAAPALLALSGPITLALRTLPSRAHRALLRVLHSPPAVVLTFPVVAVVLDIGGLAVLYLSGLYLHTMHDGTLGALVHLHMFLSGCLLSWVVIGIDPMPRRPGYRGRLVTLVFAAAAHDTLSKFLYARDLPAGAGPLTDRHAGAEVMYYGGTLVDLLLAVALMAQWYRAGGREYRRRLRRAGIPVTATR